MTSYDDIRTATGNIGGAGLSDWQPSRRTPVQAPSPHRRTGQASLATIARARGTVRRTLSVPTRTVLFTLIVVDTAVGALNIALARGFANATSKPGTWARAALTGPAPYVQPELLFITAVLITTLAVLTRGFTAVDGATARMLTVLEILGIIATLPTLVTLAVIAAILAAILGIILMLGFSLATSSP